jgi:hypothetical protein
VIVGPQQALAWALLRRGDPVIREILSRAAAIFDLDIESDLPEGNAESEDAEPAIVAH